MTHIVYTVKWHIGNVFNKPPRQNAPMDRVLTSVILKGIEWAFRKVYPKKNPRHGAPGSIGTSKSICIVGVTLRFGAMTS